jgi:hypothetical protein
MGKSHCQQSVLFTCNMSMSTDDSSTSTQHTKNFLLANKNIPDEGQGSWFMKSQESLYDCVSLKI